MSRMKAFNWLCTKYCRSCGGVVKIVPVRDIPLHAACKTSDEERTKNVNNPSS